MLLMARCTPNLYEYVLSISNADFRLYEFLKNSRIKHELDDQTTYVAQQQNNLACQVALLMNIFGGG
jgi:hypothetical protein